MSETDNESALVKTVREYIAVVGVPAALEAAQAANIASRAGGKPLTAERVQAVLDGEALPSFSLCVVAFEQHLARLPQGGRTAPAAPIPTDPTLPDFTPLPVQPWEAHVNPPEARQPWATRVRP